MVYSWTYGFHDGAVMGVAPDRKPTDKKIKQDRMHIDEDGVFRETLYDSTYWHSWKLEKRVKLAEVLANRLNMRRSIRELVLPELESLQQLVQSLQEQLARIELKLDRNDV